MSDHGISTNETNMILEVVKPFIDQIEDVKLFGSRATGKYRVNSDIDLVFYGSLTQRTLDRLYTEFEESYLSKTVDVQAYHLIKNIALKEHIDNNSMPLFKREINSQGEPAFSPDTSALSSS
jgi:uncharacterized protein